MILDMLNLGFPKNSYAEMFVIYESGAQGGIRGKDDNSRNMAKDAGGREALGSV